MLKHKKTGFFYPKDSGSENAIKEAYYLKDYGGLPSVVNFTGKTVMDCGAHIGTFSRRAFEEGAAKVICYEPFPECIEALKLNIPTATIIEAAVAKQSGTADFHFRNERLEGSSLIHKGANQVRWNYKTMQVTKLSFFDELHKIKPNILKMDIEGEEWNIFEDGNKQLPDYVEALFIEVHGLYSKGWQQGIDFINKIYPNSTEISKTLLVPFKSKPDRITNLSALFIHK